MSFTRDAPNNSCSTGDPYITFGRWIINISIKPIRSKLDSTFFKNTSTFWNTRFNIFYKLFQHLNIVDSTFINLHQYFLRKKSPVAPFLSGSSAGGGAPAQAGRRGGAAAAVDHGGRERRAAAASAACAQRQHAQRGCSSHARSSRRRRQHAARGAGRSTHARSSSRRQPRAAGGAAAARGGRRIGLRRSNGWNSLHESQTWEGGKEKNLVEDV